MPFGLCERPLRHLSDSKWIEASYSRKGVSILYSKLRSWPLHFSARPRSDGSCTTRRAVRPNFFSEVASRNESRLIFHLKLRFVINIRRFITKFSHSSQSSYFVMTISSEIRKTVSRCHLAGNPPARDAPTGTCHRELDGVAEPGSRQGPSYVRVRGAPPSSCENRASPSLK